MSHFTVLVHVTGADNLDRALAKLRAMMARYEEDDGGNIPDEWLSFAKINDTYEDNKEWYGSEEEWMDDNCLVRNDEGEIGHMTNELGYWDWYVIGGRYSNRVRVKNARPMSNVVVPTDHVFRSNQGALYGQKDVIAGRADGARVSAIDMVANTIATYEGCARTQALFDMGKIEASFGEPTARHYLSESGELAVYGEKEFSDLAWDPKTHSATRWTRMVNDEERVFYTVVAKEIDTASPFARGFHNPLVCYAYLSDDGWLWSGATDGFGISNPNGERVSYYAAVQEAIDSADDSDWLFVVDCHT